MSRDHKPITYNDCRGLYTRRDIIVPPDGYLSKADNLVYSPATTEDPTNFGWVRVRESFVQQSILPAIPIRFYIYTKATGNRIILLDKSGNFWDSGSGTIILTIPDAIDFHGLTLNDQFYFTPHNRVTGLPGQFVYVYNPTLSATARKAAGAPLTGTFSVSVSSVAGTIEPGLHVVAISYQTDTGYRSKPSLHKTFTAPTPGKRLNADVIPLGPASAVKRLIWMSQVITSYDGNIEAVPLFLVYTIDNNTTTALLDTIDAYDTQLTNTADVYLDLIPEIPAGTFLTVMNGGLVVCGAFNDPLAIRVSNANEPEAFDAIDGVKEILPGYGGGVKTTRVSRGNLLFWKSNLTGILRPNGDVPHNWPIEVIDGALGSEVYGVGEVLNRYEVSYDIFLVANETGLHVFNGTVYVNPLKPLTWPIEPDWEFSERTRVIIDPVNYRIYVITTDDEGSTWYYAEFHHGLNSDGIKWSLWNFNYPKNVSEDLIDAHVLVDSSINTENTVLLAIAEGSNILRRFVTNTISLGSDALGDFLATLAIRLADPELRWFHIGPVRFSAGASLAHNEGKYAVGVTGFTTEPFQPEVDNTIVVNKFFDANGTWLETFISALGGDLSIARLIVYVKVIGEEAEYK